MGCVLSGRRFTLGAVIAFVIVACLAPSLRASATEDVFSRPGTIAHTRTLPDYSDVTLDSMIVQQVSGDYVFVRDPWSANTLPVYARGQLSEWNVIEVSGHTATVCGQRIVVADEVRRYAWSSGGPAPMLPKGPEPLDWPYMQSVALDTSPGDIPCPPSSLEQSLFGQFMLTQMMEESVSLEGVIVIAGRGDDLANDTFYVEDLSRSNGWKIVYEGTSPIISRGDIVSVEGDTDVDTDGEAYIDATAVTVGSTDEVKPLAMLTNRLGGHESQDGRPGVTTSAQSHLYNKGLLVTCWGKVTYVDETNDYFYIDDGCAADDGSGHVGVKVSWSLQAAGLYNPEIKPPQEDWYVTVTGVSASEAPDEVIPVLRLRKQDDIKVREPQDEVEPVVEITDPAGSQIFKLPSATSVLIEGTAEDEGTGVANVQVRIGSGGTWQTAAFDPNTHVWTYTWNNPCLDTVYVQATDLAGNVGEAEPSAITVLPPTAIHVKTDGNNTNTGCTWEDAKLTIQAGLNTASTEGISQVWVRAGTYEERITLKPSVGLYGGFEGDESARNERPSFPRDTADSYASVIDGQSGGNAVASSTVNTSTTIDGFTILHGSPCGVYCTGTCTPSIANNTIRECVRGIEFYHSTLTTGWVHHNYISGNGTGVACSTRSSAVIEDNHIDHNGTTSGLYGMGISVSDSSSPTIERNWIEYNGSSSSGYDGGGIWCDSSTPLIRNNLIKGNTATNGGGIWCTTCTPTITNNTIVNTACGSSGYGGGVYLKYSVSVVANNVIAFNTGHGVYKYTSSQAVTLHKNCSYSNTPANYSTGLDYTDDILHNPYLTADHVHLTSNSIWCIDQSNGTYCTGTYDLDGDARKIDGDQNGSMLGDVGADEYVP